MILVSRDRKGLELVLEQMLERDYDLFRLTPQLHGKTDDEKARRLGLVVKVTLSPGYERWAAHLMLIERQQKLGLPLGELLADEVAGLEVLDLARRQHRSRHPECFACGMPQPAKFLTQCVDCETKYRKRSR